MQEMDCARTRLRGRTTSYYLGDAPQPVAAERSEPRVEWQPVGDDERPLFQAICGFLLGGFAARLPLFVMEAPDLVNTDEVKRALSRAYPPLLRDSGQSGEVVLSFRVLENGTVDPATVEVVSATNAGFAAAARRVALTMRFRPALLNGTPVPCWSVVPVNFVSLGAPPRKSLDPPPRYP
jgi:TonB family protein